MGEGRGNPTPDTLSLSPIFNLNWKGQSKYGLFIAAINGSDLFKNSYRSIPIVVHICTVSSRPKPGMERIQTLSKMAYSNHLFNPFPIVRV